MFSNIKRVLIGGAITLFMLPQFLEATPAFARQMGMECTACHFQNIPKLNAFGKEFKLSGFTMRGGMDALQINSDQNGGLALPSALNMGFITKARFVDNLSDTKKGETQIFDEAAFIFGGAVSENIGVSAEFAEGLAGAKFVYSTEIDLGRVGLLYHTTDALGAFAGMEVYSTGLYRPIRMFENRKKANIFQKAGVGSGAATGAQVFYSGKEGLYATVGVTIPAHAFAGTTFPETGYTQFQTMARAAYNLSVAGLDCALGGYYIGGDVEVTNAQTIETVKTSYGLDGQLQGGVAGMQTMVTFGYVLANQDYSSKDLGTGMHIDAQVNPFDVLGLKAAMMSYTKSSVVTQYTSFGAEYNLDQNVKLSVEYSVGSIGSAADSELLLMSMIGF